MVNSRENRKEKKNVISKKRKRVGRLLQVGIGIEELGLVSGTVPLPSPSPGSGLIERTVTL